MTDKITSERRSWNMSHIRATNTKPEMVVRSLIHRMGYRFSTHRKNLPGRPDIVLPKYRTIILVHGCFWHQHTGCIEASQPKSNTAYWRLKLKRNVERDKKNRRLLRKQGWRVLRLWECEIEKDPIRVVLRIARELSGRVDDKRLQQLPSRRDLLKAAEARAGYKCRKR